MKANIRRQVYFDTSIHRQKIKDCISGNNEKPVIKVLESLGYRLGKDFVRQHPVGSKFVCDFAFVNEKIVLEVDGSNHRAKRQRKEDKKRDKFFIENNWIVIRIDDRKMFGDGYMFYKFLIKDVVKERRRQYQEGRLYAIDIPDYNDEDYD